MSLCIEPSVSIREKERAKGKVNESARLLGNGWKTENENKYEEVDEIRL